MGMIRLCLSYFWSLYLSLSMTLYEVEVGMKGTDYSDMIMFK